MRPIALSLFTLLTTALAADPAMPVDAPASSPTPTAQAEVAEPAPAQVEPATSAPAAAQVEPAASAPAEALVKPATSAPAEAQVEPAASAPAEALVKPATSAPVQVEPATSAPAAAQAEPHAAETPSKLDSMGGPLENFYHGFRVGYTYVNRTDSSSWSRLRSPHLFVLGYEGTQVIEGGGWLDVIIVLNATVSGLNQNLLIPSGNLLVGFELADQIQIGTGINATLGTDKLVHQVIAVGWTPKAGEFNVPVHMIVIPDVDGNWRLGMTVGVNW